MMYSEIPKHTLWSEWGEKGKNTKCWVKKESKENSHMLSLQIKCFTPNYITNEHLLFSLSTKYNLLGEMKTLLVYVHYEYSLCRHCHSSIMHLDYNQPIVSLSLPLG